MEETVLLCEDSLEGIFTAVYEAYARKLIPEKTRIIAGEEDNYRLFAVYYRIKSDESKAVKVMRTVQGRFGLEVYIGICRALACDDVEKANAVYHTIAEGLKAKRPDQIMGNLANSYIRTVFELDRNAANEIHRLKEFIRFQELEQGILFAKIGPKHNIITFLTPHFAERLPLENFIIYDELRNLIVLHPAGKEWYIRQGTAPEEGFMKNYTEDEMEYQELFRYFCHKIAIKERRNLDLQRNMLPLRFRKYMTEFNK